MSFLDWTGLGSSATSTAATSFVGAFHLAGGGAVSGPGSATSDSIPAMLSNGEYVLNAAAVDRIGVSRLDTLNSGAHRAANGLARYATGGYVGAAQSVTPAGNSNTNVNISVDASDCQTGFTKEDAAWLQKQVQALVDKRIARNMGGDGGMLWKYKKGMM